MTRVHSDPNQSLIIIIIIFVVVVIIINILITNITIIIGLDK